MAEPTPETAAEERAATTAPTTTEKKASDDAKGKKSKAVNADDATASETSTKKIVRKVVETVGGKPTITVLDRFLKKTGYDQDDIDAWNEKTRIFCTTNGGKYHINKAGEVRILKGPRFPRYEPEGIGA